MSSALRTLKDEIQSAAPSTGVPDGAATALSSIVKLTS
jgi:hypothetical protein